MTTIRHVLDGFNTDQLSSSIVSGCVVLAVGYAVGQMLRGWLSRRTRGSNEQ